MTAHILSRPRYSIDTPQRAQPKRHNLCPNPEQPPASHLIIRRPIRRRRLRISTTWRLRKPAGRLVRGRRLVLPSSEAARRRLISEATRCRLILVVARCRRTVETRSRRVQRVGVVGRRLVARVISGCAATVVAKAWMGGCAGCVRVPGGLLRGTVSTQSCWILSLVDLLRRPIHCHRRNLSGRRTL